MKKTQSLTMAALSFGIILLVAFTVNGILGISGFKDTYTDALRRQYTIQGNYIKGRMESALHLGKKLYLLQGYVEPLFQNVINRSDGINHIYVANRTGRIQYSTRKLLKQKYIPFAGPPENQDELDVQGYFVNFMDSTFIGLPLYSGKDAFEGSLFIEFNRSVINNYLYAISRDIAGTATFIFFISLFFYVIFLRLGGESHKADVILTTVLLLASQIAFTAYNEKKYNKAITDIFSKNMSVLAKSIADDIQKPLEYVSSFENMAHAEKYLTTQLEQNPQCSGIFFTDGNLRVSSHVRSSEKTVLPERISRQNRDFYILPVISGNTTSYLAFQINRGMINTILREMTLDAITIIVVALIFASILKDFFSFITRSGLKKKLDEKNSLRLIRISTFLFMFAAFEPLSFIPLLIKDLYARSPGPYAGMPVDQAVSLPVSSYMLGITLAMFFSLFAMKKFHIRIKYVFMTIIFVIGSIMTGAVTSMTWLIGARFVTGFGFGGVLLNTASLVINYTSSRNRSSGFGTNAAAFAAASITSIPVGGVVVSQFGYNMGLWVSIAFAMIFLLFSFFCITPLPSSSGSLPEKVQSLGGKRFLRVLFSRHVLSYIFFINIPFQLIYVGLFQFLFPLYMDDTLHLSQGNIGRILSVFSLISLGASLVSRLSDRFRNDKLLIALGAMIVGLTLILFNYGPAGSIILFIAVLGAMGVDNVFIDAIEEVYVASGNLGGISEEDLLQSYKTIEKIISVGIPALTSAVIIALGFSGSLQAIGIYSVTGALLFLLFGKNGRWMELNQAREVSA